MTMNKNNIIVMIIGMMEFIIIETMNFMIMVVAMIVVVVVIMVEVAVVVVGEKMERMTKRKSHPLIPTSTVYIIKLLDMIYLFAENLQQSKRKRKRRRIMQTIEA